MRNELTEPSRYATRTAGTAPDEEANFGTHKSLAGRRKVLELFNGPWSNGRRSPAIDPPEIPLRCRLVMVGERIVDGIPSARDRGTAPGPASPPSRSIKNAFETEKYFEDPGELLGPIEALLSSSETYI
jgi:hypothetical protein